MYISLENIEHSFTKIYRKYNGKNRIGDLCGSCYKEAKSAKRLAQVIQKYCPGVEIEALHLSSVYEVLVGSEIEYTTPEELHQQVLGVAHAVDVGVEIGKEMLGKNFIR